jgi:LAO/AO transport system kinase
VIERLPGNLETLLADFRAGKRAALARAISLVENERDGFQAFLHEVMAGAGVQRARRLGITGPPGAGKSTLIAEIADAYVAARESVGIVAVDPTSPFTGGALLGDRIRMNDLATSSEVFIRSMATRGSLGGLATATREVLDLMDAFGFGRVLVETVGVGQTELEIAGAADTVVVVLVPESGDGVQAMKAGLMEIADLFVVNKADRPGADRLIRDLGGALRLRTASANGWRVPVLRTVAQSGEGVAELVQAVDEHRAWLESSGALAERRRARAERRVRDIAERALRRLTWSDPEAARRLAAGVEAVASGRETPYSVARDIVGELFDHTDKGTEA